MRPAAKPRYQMAQRIPAGAEVRRLFALRNGAGADRRSGETDDQPIRSIAPTQNLSAPSPAAGRASSPTSSRCSRRERSWCKAAGDGVGAPARSHDENAMLIRSTLLMFVQIIIQYQSLERLPRTGRRKPTWIQRWRRFRKPPVCPARAFAGGGSRRCITSDDVKRSAPKSGPPLLPRRDVGRAAAARFASYAVFSTVSPSSSVIFSRMMNFCALPVTVSGNSSTKRT
jgi:hypothetical protein